MGDNDGNVKSGFKNNSKKSSRILFIVHREQIAKQAMKSYKNVFGRSKTYGLLSGNSKDTDADILFATMQMMSKEEVMNQFSEDCFKTIVSLYFHKYPHLIFFCGCFYNKTRPTLVVDLVSLPPVLFCYDNQARIYNNFRRKYPLKIRKNAFLKKDKDRECPISKASTTLSLL